MIPLIRILWGFLVAMTFHATAMAHSQVIEDLLLTCQNISDYRKFDILIEKGKELVRISGQENDSDMVYAGEAYILEGMIHLRSIEDIESRVAKLQHKINLIKDSDHFLTALLCQTVAAYFHFLDSDFNEAIEYAKLQLINARCIMDRKLECNALSRMASIYMTINDSRCLEIANQCDSIARNYNLMPQMYVATCHIADYLYNQGHANKSLSNLNKALSIADSLHMDSEMAYIYAFMGDIYDRLEDYTKAEQFYKQAMDVRYKTYPYDLIYVRICYAGHLIQLKRQAEALRLLKSADSISMNNSISVFQPMILQSISECYETSGDLERALIYYKKSTEAYKKTIVEKNYRKGGGEVAILNLINHVSKEKTKNAYQELELMKKTRIIIICGFILLLLIVIVIFGYIYHRRKMQLNEIVVKRYLENIEKEHKLRKQLEEAVHHIEATSKHGSQESVVIAERHHDIFVKLENMMRKEKIYRQADLSLEKVAEMLATNRTYLSKIVNEKAGQSFPAYVNSYRIEEAIEILSCLEKDVPIKDVYQSVGFTARSAFYTSFKQKMDMSPTAFRESIRKIKG